MSELQMLFSQTVVELKTRMNNYIQCKFVDVITYLIYVLILVNLWQKTCLAREIRCVTVHTG